MSHVVLLGDSIFDNARYVPGGPPVIDQLRGELPASWRATLLAVDGAVTTGVAGQLRGLAADATHLVVSVGGNDALMNSGVVRDAGRRAGEAFADLAAVQEGFRRDYRAMLTAVLATGKAAAVCTIYDAIPGLSRVDVTGLSVFNDVIVREALRAGVPVLDLRAVCTEAADYSPMSPIEPSEAGGVKIAAAIARVLSRHDFSHPTTTIYGPT